MSATPISDDEPAKGPAERPGAAPARIGAEREGPAGSDPPPPASAERAVRSRGSRTRWLPLLLLALALAALAWWGGDWVRGRFLYVHEVDARVVSDMIAVPTRVEGWVTEFEASEGQRVAPGDRLARVDSRSAELKLAELEAELEGLRAERERVGARRTMVDEQTRSRARSVRSRLTAARALADALAHESALATAEYERARKLSTRGVVSATELDRARTAHHRAKQDALRAQAEIAEQEARLAETEAERRQLDVLDADVRVLDQRIAQHEARVAQQALALAEHDVVTPIGGVISRTFVDAGEYVRVGQRVALVHDPADIRVEANIRETEIGKVVVGQKVRIVVDAYPDLPIEGRVERIGQAATSEFALLPTPNPSGNFTKVTQRLPIRISADQHNGLLRPGMLVEIYIDVSDPAGP